MDRLQYLAVMAACLLVTLPLELLFGARVWRRPWRTAKAIAPAFVVFVAWDLWASAEGTWTFADHFTIGIRLPGGMVLEELVFFVVVPICTLLTFETLRLVSLRWRAGAPLVGRR